MFFTADTPTLPLPIKGSRIVSFSFDNTLTKCSIKASGFCVGCFPYFFSLFDVTDVSINSRYYTSLSYTGQDGTLIGTDFMRISGKISLDSDISNYFRVYTNLNFGYTKNNITNGIYGQALTAPPTISPYNEDGTYAALLAPYIYNHLHDCA